MYNEKKVTAAVFSHEEFGKMRALVSGEKVELCLEDMCRALSLRLDEVVSSLSKAAFKTPVLTKYPLQTEGGMHQMTFVHEDGIYDVIWSSRNPAAGKFHKWLTTEVLPALHAKLDVKEPNIFKHEEFGELRVLGDCEKAKFCLVDVCRSLGIGNPSDVKNRLEDGDVSIEVIFDSLGRIQSANFVNEDGLFDVILSSRKPSAREFRKWITSEVLPALKAESVPESGVTPMVFNHAEFGEMRTFIMKDGKFLFAAVDVCAKLDIKNVSQALEDFAEDEKADISIRYISSNGVIQTRKILAVTEPGLYRLIFQSRKPSAEKFKHWVFHEVLPSLRKTGSYTMPGKEEKEEKEEKSNIFFVNTGSSEFSSETSAMWIDEKKGENLIRLAKMLGTKDLSDSQKYVLEKAFWYLTGDNLPK